MLLTQVIRGVAITGGTDTVRRGVLGRQGGRWTQQWIDSAFPQAAARSHHAPPAPDAVESARKLDDLRRRGLVTDEEVARLRNAHGI